MIIAIDGTVASGKSSAARLLAQKLGYLYINTGLMYRGVAASCRREGIDTDNATVVAFHAKFLRVDLRMFPDGQHVFVNGRDLTGQALAPDIGPLVSDVADNKTVREVLVREQRRLGREAGDAVLEGRDIQSVVFPDADIKFFVDADVRERARRRLADDQARDASLTLEDVERSLRARDERDRAREFGALKRAADAIDVDSGRFGSAEETAEYMLSVVRGSTNH
jgi:cytidylate kinase